MARPLLNRDTRLREVNDENLATWPLPPVPYWNPDAGRVLIVAGSPHRPGAALLAGDAALRLGVGSLCMATARSIAVEVGARIPEARIIGLRQTPGGGLSRLTARECNPPFDAMLVGPGLGDEDATARLVHGLRARFPRVPLVLDSVAASALVNANVAWDPLPGDNGIALLEPDELAQLTGRTRHSVVQDAARAAARAAAHWRIAVVLKGATRWLCNLQGHLWHHHAPDDGLASPGQSDVLAGAIVALAARGCGLDQAAVWGLGLQGAAAAALAEFRGRGGYLAREVAVQLPLQVHRLDRRAATSISR